MLSHARRPIPSSNTRRASGVLRPMPRPGSALQPTGWRPPRCRVSAPRVRHPPFAPAPALPPHAEAGARARGCTAFWGRVGLGIGCHQSMRTSCCRFRSLRGRPPLEPRNPPPGAPRPQPSFPRPPSPEISRRQRPVATARAHRPGPNTAGRAPRGAPQPGGMRGARPPCWAARGGARRGLQHCRERARVRVY